MPRRRDRGGAEDDSEQHLEERVLNEKCVRGRRKGGLRHHDCGDETGVEETAKTERHQVQGPAAHRRDEQKKCFACGKRGHVQAECPDLRGLFSYARCEMMSNFDVHQPVLALPWRLR